MSLPVLRNQRLDDFARLGQWLAWSESGKDDEKSRGAAAALRLYYASELGLTAMAAAELTVIGGRLFVGAALLRALARRNGYRVERVQSTSDECIARLVMTATGEVLGESMFTIAEARAAGLIRDKSAWKTHPARMLWARASKNVIVDFAPEVALGIGLDDELNEIDGPPPPPPPSDVPWHADHTDDDPDEPEVDANQLAFNENGEPVDADGNPIEF